MTTIIAIWGALLSTVLGVVKLREEWEKRQLRVEVDGMFTSNVEIGHRIDVRNLGSTAIILKHWQVVSIRGWWLFRKVSPIEEAEFDAGDTRIGAMDSHSLHFAEAYHFPYVDRAIWIRLYVAGRTRPELRKVFGTSAWLVGLRSWFWRR